MKDKKLRQALFEGKVLEDPFDKEPWWRGVSNKEMHDSLDKFEQLADMLGYEWHSHIKVWKKKDK